MYCPEGFETLSNAFRRCQQIGWEWGVKQPPMERTVTPLTTTIDVGIEDTIRADARVAWLWGRFLQRVYPNFYACSPNGLVLRLDVMSAALSVYSITTDFPETHDEHCKLVGQYDDPFLFIEPRAYTISVNRPGFLEQEWLEMVWVETLQPLQGWPVCWKPPSPNIQNDDFEAFVTAPIANSGNMVSIAAKRGAPKKGDGQIEVALRNEFRHRFKSNFPEKREYYYQLAEEWVMRTFEQKVSRTTLQSYLKPLLEADAGNSA